MNPLLLNITRAFNNVSYKKLLYNLRIKSVPSLIIN